MSRLARILLALAVAFVVTARTEAAAEHCRRLAAAATVATAPITAPEATPCHDADDTAPPKTAHHPDQAPQEDCACMAVLTGFASVAPAIRSAHMEAYAWARPAAVIFASMEPAPNLRPPRT
jgi:hypothetical protein